MIDKYGYWEVSGTKFFNKVAALEYATREKKNVKFVYHDHVWRNFDRSLLGKIPLDTLYKERAQQLRDQYKYLKLYYSGGADSHNVLMTFINNNIKLDEIVIRWPKALVDGKFYDANKRDRSARNYWSEWDFAVKPVLDWLANTHPEIKINIVDFTDGIDTKTLESIMPEVNHTRAGLLQVVPLGLDLRENVGHIYGIDKPTLYVDGNDIYMFFSDFGMTMAYTNDTDSFLNPNKECFYWAPEFPLLPYEMAYQVFQYYNIDKAKRRALYSTEEGKQEFQISEQMQQFLVDRKHQAQNNVAKSVCYTTWNEDIFQADKPVSATRQDKFFWFFESKEFEQEKDAFLSNVKSLTANIGSEFLTGDKSVKGFKVIKTDLYFVGKLE